MAVYNCSVTVVCNIEAGSPEVAKRALAGHIDRKLNGDRSQPREGFTIESGQADPAEEGTPVDMRECAGGLGRPPSPPPAFLDYTDPRVVQTLDNIAEQTKYRDRVRAEEQAKKAGK